MLFNLSLLALLSTVCITPLQGDTSHPGQREKTFEPFTGKVTRTKVRLRLQPNLDGQILRELDKGDLLLVLAEDEEFYAVKPPQDFKAYIYRTYVLDNIVEGDRVNVRLEPDTESPVITQLHTGDRVNGIVSPINSRWLEITPPPSSRFFVCKEYVENVGDPTAIVFLESAKKEAALRNTLGAPLPPLSTETHLAFVEASEGAPAEVTPSMEQPKQPIRDWNQAFDPGTKTDKMLGWIPIEKDLYDSWSMSHEDAGLQTYYSQQVENSFIVRGLIEPYHRAVKNKPGDYILVNKGTNLPIAYLYSTQEDLQQYIGEEVTMRVTPRPNHHFAFPAYFVLAIE